MRCPICNLEENIEAHNVTVRSGKLMKLFHCNNCHHEFFAHNPSKDISSNIGDEKCLKSSGLDIPTREIAFQNGIKQSLPYILEFIDKDDIHNNILEIGCSWGYFLKLLADQNIIPYGVEINPVRSNYVINELGITCAKDISEYENQGIKFNKIFLPYVIDFIPDPVNYLRRLINLLNPNGKLILITPNQNEALREIYHNKGYTNFMYNEITINYFSMCSITKLVEMLNLRPENVIIETREGYSFINHINWFLNQSPRTTDLFAGDRYMDILIKSVKKNSNINSGPIFKELPDLISKFNVEYNKLLEKYNYGNQIWLIITKK